MSAVYKRKWQDKDGKDHYNWGVTYTDDFGKRIRRSGFKTKAEAEIVLSKAITNISAGQRHTQDKNITFSMAATEFMDFHAELYCKPSTKNGYNTYLKNHLIPFWGNTKLIDITPKMVNIFIKDKIVKSKLSNNTINKMLILMGSIIQKQVDEGLLFQNPVRKIRKLKIDHNEMRFLIPEEIHKALETAKEHYPDFHPLLLTAIMTGMRRGEILALTWGDINWVTGKIYVNKSLYRGQIITPKTNSSIRKIDMASELTRVLKEWHLKCTPSDKDLVFSNTSGNLADADNLIKRRFDPTLRRAGIDKIRFHDLRHTYASILIAQNVPIKYIQQQMGHSSIQVTMDRYGHLMPEVHQKGVAALDNLFSPSSKDYSKVTNTKF